MLKYFFNKKDNIQKDSRIELKDGSYLDTDIWWLQRELEFQQQNEKFQFRTNESHALKFGEMVNSLFDIRKEELAVLSINDGTLRIIENENEIWNYEFLSHYKRNEKGEYAYYREGCSKLPNQIVLTLAYRTYEKGADDKDKSISKKDAMLIVHLQYPLGIKDEAFYIQATFCRPPIMLERSKKGINPQAQNLSILIAFDYKPGSESTDEFYKIFNSAKDKLNNNKVDKCDYLEKELLSMLFYPEIAKEFYFGKKTMAEDRYWDAIVYFENAFKGLQQQWWDNELTDEPYKMLLESSFLIGFCYYEIGLFDKGVKYLEFSARMGEKVYKYQSEFINCLIAQHDIRSLMIIDEHLQILTNKPQEERTESDYDFYMFLIRRKSYCLIELKQFTEAKIYLKQILQNEPTNAFALKEMEYIKQLNQI